MAPALLTIGLPLSMVRPPLSWRITSRIHSSGMSNRLDASAIWASISAGVAVRCDPPPLAQALSRTVKAAQVSNGFRRRTEPPVIVQL